MKRLILFELILLFLASTFQTDSPGWVQQTLPRTDVTVQDIFFIDSLNGHIVVRKNSNDSAIIYRTTDGGNNWVMTFQDNIYLTSIRFANINTGYSVGSAAPSGIIKKTTNGGQNWFTVSTIGAYPVRDLSFVNTDTGWICSDDLFAGGIFQTTNGGLTWQQQLTGVTAARLFFINKDTGWAVSNDANSRLFRTTNSGANWNLQFTFSGNSSSSLYFATKDTGYITGVYKTTDGGFTWLITNNSQAGRGIYFINGRTGWAGDLFSVIQKTVDGQNWYTQTTPIFNNSSIRFVDSMKGWAGGSGIVHTSDGGGPPVGIQQINAEIPKNYLLFQNYPNPFNPSTIINYQLTFNSIVKLRVFDITGKQITILVNQKQSAGTYRVDFNGSNLPSGVYFYQLSVSSEQLTNIFKETRRMILIK